MTRVSIENENKQHDDLNSNYYCRASIIIKLIITKNKTRYEINMPLIPMLFSHWWEDLDRPHRMWDQNFGMGLHHEDLLRAGEPSLMIRPRTQYQHYHPYGLNHTRKSGGVSTVHADKNKFQVNLDVQQFTPEEITVKISGRNVVVEGKHEEKQDEHGSISRQFIRKYLVPEQCDIEQLQSKLSSDGVLSLICPRKQSIEDKSERIIPIQQTGQPINIDTDKTVALGSSGILTRAGEKTTKNGPAGEKATKNVSMGEKAGKKGTAA